MKKCIWKRLSYRLDRSNTYPCNSSFWGELLALTWFSFQTLQAQKDFEFMLDDNLQYPFWTSKKGIVFKIQIVNWKRYGGKTRVFGKNRVFSTKPGFPGQTSVLLANPGNFKGLEDQGIYIYIPKYINTPNLSCPASKHCPRQLLDHLPKWLQRQHLCVGFELPLVADLWHLPNHLAEA